MIAGSIFGECHPYLPQKPLTKAIAFKGNLNWHSPLPPLPWWDGSSTGFCSESETRSVHIHMHFLRLTEVASSSSSYQLNGDDNEPSVDEMVQSRLQSLHLSRIHGLSEELTSRSPPHRSSLSTSRCDKFALFASRHRRPPHTPCNCV